MIFNSYFETAWNPGMLSIEVMSHSTSVRFLGSSHWIWPRNCKTVSATSLRYLYNLEWAAGNPGMLSVEVKSHSTSVRFLRCSHWIWLRIFKTVSAIPWNICTIWSVQQGRLNWRGKSVLVMACEIVTFLRTKQKIFFQAGVCLEIVQ